MGSGMPNQLLDVRLHTIEISGLSRVSNRTSATAPNPAPGATSSTSEPPVCDCTTTNEAAPVFAVFKGWVSRMCAKGDLVLILSRVIGREDHALEAVEIPVAGAGMPCEQGTEVIQHR